jgi:hypothetical protein
MLSDDHTVIDRVAQDLALTAEDWMSPAGLSYLRCVPVNRAKNKIQAIKETHQHYKCNLSEAVRACEAAFGNVD